MSGGLVEGFVVLRVSIKYVSLIGRALISPPSTLLIAGDEEPIAQPNWRAEMKIKDIHRCVHGENVLRSLTFILQRERLVRG